jgi:hypothetical protein
LLNRTGTLGTGGTPENEYTEREDPYGRGLAIIEGRDASLRVREMGTWLKGMLKFCPLAIVAIVASLFVRLIVLLLLWAAWILARDSSTDQDVGADVNASWAAWVGTCLYGAGFACSTCNDCLL